jgi:selenophosphate synthetase-related protein
MESDQSYLQKFVENLTNFSNIQRKYILFPIMDRVRKESAHSDKVYRGMGEDSAAIYLNDSEDDTLILFTSDAITEEFSTKSPFNAGFSGIMVGVDDIHACGGVPLAASCIISSDDPAKRDEIMSGVLEGSRRFNVPIVRGHTSDSTKNIGISTSIIGKVEKVNYISAGGADIGDALIIIADFEGRVGKSSKYFWDTVTYKKSEEILKKRQILRDIASKKLAKASKDISNGGIFGTLILMLNYIGYLLKQPVGALIEIEKLQMPQSLIELGYDIGEFCKMYLTSSFIMAVDPKNIPKIQSLSKSYGMTTFEIGQITEGDSITMKYREQQQTYKQI